TPTWNIDGEDDLSGEVTGRRIIVWPFPPHWSTPSVESLDCRTDIITSYDGSEQRVALRSKPRRAFEYSSTLVKSDSAIASNLLFGWHNRNFAVPLWTDKSILTSPAAAGDEELQLSTVNRGFFNGGLLLLMNSTTDFEAIEIESFTSS